MLNVFSPTRGKIVDGNYFISVLETPFRQVGTNKTCASSYQISHWDPLVTVDVLYLNLKLKVQESDQAMSQSEKRPFGVCTIEKCPGEVNIFQEIAHRPPPHSPTFLTPLSSRVRVSRALWPFCNTTLSWLVSFGEVRGFRQKRPAKNLAKFSTVFFESWITPSGRNTGGRVRRLLR